MSTCAAMAALALGESPVELTIGAEFDNVFFFLIRNSCRSFLYHFREKRVSCPFLSPRIFYFFYKKIYIQYTSESMAFPEIIA